MRLLRQINEDIKVIKNDIEIDKLGVRSECDKYLIYVDALVTCVESINKELNERFNHIGSLNIDVWKSDDPFLKKYLYRLFYENKMGKISSEMQYAKRCQRELNNLNVRLNQIKYLL